MRYSGADEAQTDSGMWSGVGQTVQRKNGTNGVLGRREERSPTASTVAAPQVHKGVLTTGAVTSSSVGEVTRNPPAEVD